MSAKDQITQLVDRFKKESYLKDKTNAMGDGLLLGAQLADDANETSKKAEYRAALIEKRYKDFVLENDLNPGKDPEVTGARGGFDTLEDREDYQDLKVNEIEKEIEEDMTVTTARFLNNEFDLNILKKKNVEIASYGRTNQYYFYKNIRNTVRDSNFALGIITDTHYNDDANRVRNYNTLQEVKSFNNVVDKLEIQDKLLLGDILNGDYTNSNLFNDINVFEDYVEDYLKIIGNHDVGDYIEDLQIRNPINYGAFGENYRLSPLDIHSWFYKRNKTTNCDSYTHAFFKDYNEQKIRIIHVNTSDLPSLRNVDGTLRYPGINAYGVSPRQIKWLNDNAFNFASKGTDAANWKIIIISHVPLVPQLSGSDIAYWDGSQSSIDTLTRTKYPNYYNGGFEVVANEGILRQMIRNINRGTNNLLKPYLNSETKVTSDGGLYYESTLVSTSNPLGVNQKTMTAEKHAENLKYWGTNFGIDGTTNDFSINVNNPYAIPVIACLSGHMHRDDYYDQDESIHHVTLMGIANKDESDGYNLDDYAQTIMIYKNNEIFFYRQGRGKTTVNNPIIDAGTTSYGIDKFSNKRFIIGA